MRTVVAVVVLREFFFVTNRIIMVPPRIKMKVLKPDWTKTLNAYPQTFDDIECFERKQKKTPIKIHREFTSTGNDSPQI